jgi:hypothetical protein
LGFKGWRPFYCDLLDAENRGKALVYWRFIGVFEVFQGRRSSGKFSGFARGVEETAKGEKFVPDLTPSVFYAMA